MLHAYPEAAIPRRGARVFGYLGGGTYAAVAGDGPDTAASVAMVELTGDPVRIVPRGLRNVPADGTVTVTADRWNDGRTTMAFLDCCVGAVVLRTDERVAERVVGCDRPSRRFRIVDRAQTVEPTIDRDGS